MINWKVSAAVVVAAVSAQPVYAADFIKYTFQTTGSGWIVTTDFRTGRQSYSQVRGVAVSYILPVTGTYADAYTTMVGGNRIFSSPTTNINPYQGGFTKATATATTFGIEEFGTASRGVSGSTIVTACGQLNSIFPTESFYALPGCGAAKVLYNAGGSLGNYSLNYAGAVDRVDVELGTGTPPQAYGFFGFVAFVPEPSSWVMMIVGFGLASYSIRRRKYQVMIV